MKNRFPTFWHLLAILGLFVLFTVPFSLLDSLFPASSKPLAMLIAYVFPMIITIWAVMKIYNLKGSLNYKVSHLSILPVIIVASYAFLIVGEFTVEMLPKPSGIFKTLFDSMNEAMTVIFKSKVIGFLMIAVAAPILEETLFRGIILKYLLKKVNPWKAIIFTALAFGIFHMNPWQLLYATVLGILLGYIYWKTRSLFYPIIIHFVLNGTAFMAAQYADIKANDGISDSFESKNSLYLAVAISLILIYVIYLFLEKYFAQDERKLVLATQNKHKIAEIEKILPKNIKLISMKDIGFKGDLVETGNTLEANARQKMRQIAVPYAVDVLADDTGLEVAALDGAPGVYSARYAGEQASYEDNAAKLMQEMEGVTDRSAQFKTIIALSDTKDELYFSGILKGSITKSPRGTGGFGYDAVFIPEGYTQTFAEMGEEEKNKISHRFLALQKLKEYFERKD